MATKKIIDAYRELYAIFRNNPIRSNLSRIRTNEQYLKFRDFGKKLWNEVNNIVSDTSIELSDKKARLTNELQGIVDLSPVILNRCVTEDTFLLNEDEFYDLILQSQPSIEVEFAASAAVKEIKAWKDIIQAKISPDPFEESEDNPLYQTIINQHPKGLESFRYKVINFFSIKENPIIFPKNGSVPQFKTEGAGQVDVSIIDYDGVTHQSAATATQLNQLGFESDQVLRHWGVEQVYSFEHQEQMGVLSSALRDGEYDKFLKDKDELISGRPAWVARQNDNIKSKEGQRKFIKRKLTPIIEEARDNLGHMFYAPEVPKSTSGAINDIAFEIEKGVKHQDDQITSQRLYKALIAQVMEAQFGNLAYLEGTDHKEMLLSVADKIFINSKSMGDREQLNTEENVDRYITSISYGREVFADLKDVNFINLDRLMRGFENFTNEKRSGEVGNSVFNIVRSLTKKRKNADINTISLSMLIQMGIDVVELQKSTKISENIDEDYELSFSSPDIHHCATKASLDAMKESHSKMKESNSKMKESNSKMKESLDAKAIEALVHESFDRLISALLDEGGEIEALAAHFYGFKISKNKISKSDYIDVISTASDSGNNIVMLINNYNESVERGRVSQINKKNYNNSNSSAKSN